MLYFHAVRGADAGAKINNPRNAGRTRQNIPKPHRVRAVRGAVDISRMHRQNFNCNDEKHFIQLEKLHAELTGSLLAASSSAFITTGNKKETKFYIPDWNIGGQMKTSIAKADLWLWVNPNRMVP